MYKFLSEAEDNSFSWEMLGDLGSGRENLGASMPVLVYRLFQYTMRDVINKEFGVQAGIDIFRKAGELAGSQFAKNVLDLSVPLDKFISDLQNALKQNVIGVLRIEHFDPENGNMTMTVGEDLDCSGLPITGETVCHYDEGFIAGILKTYTKQNYVVREVDCWSTGARVCRFKACVGEIK